MSVPAVKSPFSSWKPSVSRNVGKGFFADHTSNHKCTGELETVLRSLKEVRASKEVEESGVLILR